MEDLKSILSSHHSKAGTVPAHAIKPLKGEVKATTSEIPDLFFDEILILIKLTRTEVLTMMYLYRITWCKPNLHRKFGIAPFISHTELAASLDTSNEILHQTIRRLEGFGFIETIRSGQYFVRKFFTEENDRKYGQTYDNFL
jgi:DNA-binding MarR family transcriptional regulator